MATEHVKSTIKVPTRTLDHSIHGSISQTESDDASKPESANMGQNDSNKEENEKDIDENMTHITKFNPSEQDEIVGEPIDFSFCDVQNVYDLIKLKPNSGRRKSIPKETKKSDTDQQGLVSTATIKACTTLHLC